ncbi:hypothetical protein SBA4_4050006 [Candidatus Sulfopaludibacter sp. SbA4]|nr:hypothetical protein SBA4_4050006 [Candidatus Sulfopaludibacter sp. SbA4]
MIIQRDKDQLTNAIHLHTKAEIRLVRLVESRLYSRPRIESVPAEGLSVEIDFKPGAFSIEGASLTVDTDFTFALTQEGDRDHPAVRIDCRFEGLYHLIPDYSPTTEQIEAFRAANAVFNCWPFFREYVQNMTVRMGIPPPPIPFLRLAEKQGSEEPAKVPTVAVSKRRRKVWG